MENKDEAKWYLLATSPHSRSSSPLLGAVKESKMRKRGLLGNDFPFVTGNTPTLPGLHQDVAVGIRAKQGGLGQTEAGGTFG